MVYDGLAVVYNKEETQDGMGGKRFRNGPEKIIHCKYVNHSFQRVVSGSKIDYINESKILSLEQIDSGMFIYVHDQEFKVRTRKRVKGIFVYELEEVV